ncbi:MAG: hypothetical protein L0220_30905, partial [Acidobacteria bacterium]|nr:hypothetical protein [Acidobacteriota bacterium]
AQSTSIMFNDLVRDAEFYRCHLEQNISGGAETASRSSGEIRFRRCTIINCQLLWEEFAFDGGVEDSDIFYDGDDPTFANPVKWVICFNRDTSGIYCRRNRIRASNVKFILGGQGVGVGEPYPTREPHLFEGNKVTVNNVLYLLSLHRHTIVRDNEVTGCWGGCYFSLGLYDIDGWIDSGELDPIAFFPQAYDNVFGGKFDRILAFGGSGWYDLHNNIYRRSGAAGLLSETDGNIIYNPGDVVSDAKFLRCRDNVYVGWKLNNDSYNYLGSTTQIEIKNERFYELDPAGVITGPYHLHEVP